MSEIARESVSADGDTVYATVSCPKGMRRFFTGEDFFVQYDEDVSAAPESILAIPVLAQVRPARLDESGWQPVHRVHAHRGVLPPWGSHPSIDSQVRWGDTVARHDGFELSRQEKIEAIVGFVDDGYPDLPVFTCNRGTAKNCSRCEKCCRTVAGMVLTGMDPNRHGYDVDGETFALIRERLASGRWLVDEDVLFMWKISSDTCPTRSTPTGIEPRTSSRGSGSSI